MPELKVQIGADTGELKKALSEAEKALGQFGKEASDINSQLKKNAITTSRLSKETEDLNRDFKAGLISENAFGRGLLQVSKAEKKLAADSSMLSSRLLKVNKAARTLGTGGLKSVGKGAANAVPSMTSFSQIIQDAPFGIQGVANNITQLTMQFGNLSTKVGGTKAALKGMLSTLAGPAGILLAVSVVTSLMVAFGGRMGASSKKVKSLTDKNKILARSVKNLTEVTKDYISSAQTEISTLQSLLNIARDESRIRTERELAVKKLNDLYPNYLGNLTLEGVNSVKTSKSVDMLTKSLIKQAKIKGLQSRLSELFAKKFEEENQAAVKVASKFKQVLGGFGIIGKTVSERLKPVSKEIKNIESAINKLLTSDIDFDKIFGGSSGDVKLKDGIKVSSEIDFDNTPLERLFQDFNDKIEKGIEDVTLRSTPVDWTAMFNAEQLAAKILETEMRMAAFNESMRMTLENGLVGALGGIGNALGEALAQGGNVLRAIGSSLLSSMGKFLSEMGGKLIQYGTLAVIKGKLDIAIAAGGPIAIGAGIAAIAVGVALKAAGAAIGSASKKGFSGGSSSGVRGGGTSSRSFSSNRSSGGFSTSGGGTVVFEIAGDKLVGVLSRTLARNRSLGGTSTLSVTT